MVTEKQTVQAKKEDDEREVTTERDYIELVATYTKLLLRTIVLFFWTVSNL